MSLILAIEQSSAKAGMALADGDRILAEQAWTDSRLQRSRSFNFLKELLAVLPDGIRSVDVLAVGAGPGAYTGLRSALVMAQSLAMPWNKRVYSIPSTEIAAFELLEKSSRNRAFLFGDARRGQVWIRLYSRHSTLGVIPEDPSWSLASYAEVEPPPLDAVAATSEPERLAATMGRWRAAAPALHVETAYATASGLARLTALRLAKNIPSAPLLPIYLHGAVASEPMAG